MISLHATLLRSPKCRLVQSRLIVPRPIRRPAGSANEELSAVTTLWVFAAFIFELVRKDWDRIPRDDGSQLNEGPTTPVKP